MTDLTDILGVRAALMLTMIDGPVAADRVEPDPVLIFQVVRWDAKKIPRPFDASVHDDGYEIVARVDTPDTADDETPLAWSEIRVTQQTIDAAADQDPVAMITSMLLTLWADEARLVIAEHFAPAAKEEDNALPGDV
mgnify:FL=1